MMLFVGTSYSEFTTQYEISDASSLFIMTCY